VYVALVVFNAGTDEAIDYAKAKDLMNEAENEYIDEDIEGVTSQDMVGLRKMLRKFFERVAEVEMEAEYADWEYVISEETAASDVDEGFEMIDVAEAVAGDVDEAAVRNSI
jgi:hypothetical protein